MGLSIHFPYFVETRARAEKPDEDSDTCFSQTQKSDFRQYLSRAVLPAMDCVLAWLDSGESMTMSISGLAIEQIFQDETDGADIVTQAMQHPLVETLGQTYYRSVAGLFSENDEFIHQVGRHAGLVEGLAGRRPQVFASTEYVFNSSLSDTLRTLGFIALYSEGYDHLLSAKSPNYVYSCRNLPILLRNCRLSDDIAHRFHDHTWDRYPLTAEKYASWIAETPGDCIHIHLDAGIFFGSGSNSGSFSEFFSRLPDALYSRDVTTVLPSSAARNPPRGEIQLEDLGLSSSGTFHALTGIHNMLQQSAFWCLEDARHLVTDQELESWRRLQSTDHFSRMTITSGSCGRVAVRSTSQETYNYFSAYLRSLARCEAACQAHLRSLPAARALRCLPPDTAFHFHSGHRFTGYSAHSLKEFSKLLEFVPDEIFVFHQERGDFSRWITDVLGDTTLARSISPCTQSGEAAHVVKERIRKLCSRLQ
jgi:alpha-amylase